MESSYISLVNGQQVQLSLKNDFDLVAGKTYRVQPTVEFLDATVGPVNNRTYDAFAHVVARVVSHPVMWHYNPRVVVVEEKKKKPVAQSGAQTPDAVKNKGCDSKQIRMINEGWTEAVKQIDAGKAVIDASNKGGQLYSTWFGASSSNRFDHVHEVITTTHAYFGYANATIDCKGAECEPDVYAYVFPNDRTETIYLCGAYWDSPVYEQGNTLTHEIAHFEYIGGTDDFAYGQNACKKLAQSNPGRAIENSDNYSYFCEQANADKLKK